MVIFFIDCKCASIVDARPNHFNKNTALPLRCINKNELNGPGSGFPIRCGLYSQLINVHTDAARYWASSQRGWQPQPIHGQTDAARYWASSHHLFFIECFHTTSMKRDYGPDGDQSKKKYKKKLPDRTRCHGPAFGFLPQSSQRTQSTEDRRQITEDRGRKGRRF